MGQWRDSWTVSLSHFKLLILNHLGHWDSGDSGGGVRVGLVNKCVFMVTGASEHTKSTVPTVPLSHSHFPIFPMQAGSHFPSLVSLSGARIPKPNGGAAYGVSGY